MSGAGETPQKALAAILAGGQSRRFGSDKAAALVAGERLIDRVAAALLPQAEALVVCGREDPRYACLPDWPEPGLGPLGGLHAALRHARSRGFGAVLSASCDVPNLPADLRARLAGPSAACAAQQPVIGWWPAALADDLGLYLHEGRRALYGFAERIGARMAEFDPPLANINRPEDLHWCQPVAKEDDC